MEMSSRQQFSQTNASAFHGPYGDASNSSTHPLGHREGGSRVPMAPVAHMGGFLQDTESPQFQGVNNFFANSAGHQGFTQQQQPGQGFAQQQQSGQGFAQGSGQGFSLDNSAHVLGQSLVVDQSSQQGQQSNPPGANISSATSLQPKKVLSKEKPKDGRKPSSPTYRPSFECKIIEQGMTPGEILAITVYNDGVYEARKKYNRKKAIDASKKYRELKREKMKQLVAENERLKELLQGVEAKNPQFAGVMARLRTSESAHAECTQEIERLQALNANLTGRLGGSAVPLRGNAGESTVVPSLAQSQQQQPPANQGSQNTLEQQHGGQTGVSGALNDTEMKPGQFLSDHIGFGY